MAINGARTVSRDPRSRGVLIVCPYGLMYPVGQGVAYPFGLGFLFETCKLTSAQRRKEIAMNETINTPDLRVEAPEGRKPWRRPALQLLGTQAAGRYTGGATDGYVCPGADLDPKRTCS